MQLRPTLCDGIGDESVQILGLRDLHEQPAGLRVGLNGDGGVLGDGVAGNHLVVCGGLGEADVDIAHGEGVLHLGGLIGQPSQRAADDTGHQQGQSQNQRQSFLFHTRFFLSYKL